MDRLRLPDRPLLLGCALGVAFGIADILYANDSSALIGSRGGRQRASVSAASASSTATLTRCFVS